jgi:Holliday junction resolvase-like predicted endonuclease
MLRREYLIVAQNEENFCNSEESFLNFLKSNSNIKILNNGKLKYQSNTNSNLYVFDFNLKTGKIKDKEERYFLFEILLKDENDIDIFILLNNILIKTFKKINPENTRINILWDDTGRYFAIQSYPHINEVENLMRKLISKFMLINVGMNWSEEVLEKEMRKKIENRKDDNAESLLDVTYNLDFINLSNILFDKYRKKSIEDFDKLISMKEKTVFNIEELKTFSLVSNWELYFSSKINKKENQIKEKWEILYKLRNHVAHNRYISQEQYNKILGITKELKKILSEAILKLEEIKISDEDKVFVAATILNDPDLPSYVNAERAVKKWYLSIYKDTSRISLERNSPMNQVDILIERKDGELIIVEVKLYRKVFSQLDQFLRRSIEQVQNYKYFYASQKKNSQISVEIVLVLINEDEAKKMLELLKSKESYSSFRIIVGYINEDDFIPINT